MVSFIALHAPGVWQRLPPYSNGQKIGRCYIDSNRFEEFVINLVTLKRAQNLHKKRNNFNSIYFLKKFNCIINMEEVIILIKII